MFQCHICNIMWWWKFCISLGKPKTYYCFHRIHVCILKLLFLDWQRAPGSGSSMDFWHGRLSMHSCSWVHGNFQQMRSKYLGWNQRLEANSVIHSDEWRAYLNLSQHVPNCITQGTVNHTYNFVNPNNGAHTQVSLIKYFWNIR